MVHDSEASRSLDNGAAGTASTPGWPESTIAEADSQVGAAARAIRLYYFRQLSVLRQIPYLALEANGRGGWLDNYYRAYRECLYPMHQEHETWGAYDLFLELRSGVLLGASTTPSEYVITLEQTFRLGGESSMGMASDEEIYVKLAHQSA